MRCSPFRRIPLVLLAFLVLGPVACGDSSSSGDFASADTVDVTMRNSTLFMPRGVQAGAHVFRVRNIGTAARGFYLTGSDTTGRRFTDSLDAPLPPGQTQTLALDLAPGFYDVRAATPGDFSVPPDSAVQDSAAPQTPSGLDVQLTVGEGWGESALPPNSDLSGSRLRQ